MCAGLHATNGVPLLTGTTVVDWLTTDDGAGRPRVTALELSDGRRLRADVVVVGIGMAPAAGWLADSGLFLDNGVLTDAGYVTDRPNIVAVGDVARPYNPRTGRNVRREHWTDAAEGPAIAVRNLLAGQHGAARRQAELLLVRPVRHPHPVRRLGGPVRRGPVPRRRPDRRRLRRDLSPR